MSIVFKAIPGFFHRPSQPPSQCFIFCDAATFDDAIHEIEQCMHDDCVEQSLLVPSLLKTARASDFVTQLYDSVKFLTNARMEDIHFLMPKHKLRSTRAGRVR